LLLNLRLLIECLLLDVAEFGDVVAKPVDHLGLGLEEGGEKVRLLVTLLDDLDYEGLVGLLGGWLMLLLVLGLVGWWAVLVLAMGLVMMVELDG